MASLRRKRRGRRVGFVAPISVLWRLSLGRVVLIVFVRLSPEIIARASGRVEAPAGLLECAIDAEPFPALHAALEMRFIFGVTAVAAASFNGGHADRRRNCSAPRGVQYNPPSGCAGGRFMAV